MTMTTLAGEHALELGQLLQFLADWTTADRERLSVSLANYLGGSAYQLDELHADLHRFAFLLAANDGERFLDTD